MSKNKLKSFYQLWSTQAISSLGSAMTNYALVLWAYQQTGAALSTGILLASTYIPYVLFSVVAGTLSDRWDKKKTMVVSDTLATGNTLLLLGLVATGRLTVFWIVVLNGLSSVYATFQQPASEVAVTLLTPKEQYQRTSALRALSYSLINMLAPVFATVVYTILGLQGVMYFDLLTCAVAVFFLLVKIRIPKKPISADSPVSFRDSLKEGFSYLQNNRGILNLMLLLAGINLIASMYDAGLPALVLTKADANSLAVLNSVAGFASVCGSLIATRLPRLKRPVKVIWWSLFLSMACENLVIAVSDRPLLWYLGSFISWLVVPIMNTNQEMILRTEIPVELQGRVFSVRNSLQFFTIPVGNILAGFFIDKVFIPFYPDRPTSFLTGLVGTGKGAAISLFFLTLWGAGVMLCLPYKNNNDLKKLDRRFESKT